MKTKEMFTKKFREGRDWLADLGINNPSIEMIDVNYSTRILVTKENENEMLEDNKNGFVKLWHSGRGGHLLTYASLTKKGKKQILL